MREKASPETDSHKRLRLQQVAEPAIWTKHMLDALVNGVRGGRWHALYDKVYAEKTLMVAWKQVKRNKGAAGVDRVSIDKFEAKEKEYLRELQEDLRIEQFSPSAVRRVYIPKSKGKKRPLGIPTVKDRIVQTAVKMVLEPIFDNEYTATSFGFRTGLGCKDALREVDRLAKKLKWVVDIDLESYFDTIPHEALLERVEERISDKKMLKLVELFLRAEIMEEGKSWSPERGAPQGAVLSPMLANVYLNPLDHLLMEEGFSSVRYADDMVVLCEHGFEANEALDLIEEWAFENGLKLNQEKTHVGNHKRKGEGFGFLGYKFERGKRLIQEKNLKSLKDKIREETKRTCGKGLEKVVERITPILRGWFEYFKQGQKGYFDRLDRFVRRRLRAMLRRERKWSKGQGHTYRDHKEWPNAFFTERGLFTMKEARILVLQSRCGNH